MSNEIDYILDIETLGDPVIQIALLDCRSLRLLVWYPDLAAQLQRGLRVDSGTMAWWARDTIRARRLGALLAGDSWLADEMLDGEPVIIHKKERAPGLVMADLDAELAGPGRIWVRGPDYDLPRLRRLAHLHDLPDPVTYPRLMPMCLRTLDLVLGHERGPGERERAHWPDKHDAIGDVLRAWLVLERARAAGLLGSDEEAAA